MIKDLDKEEIESICMIQKEIEEMKESSVDALKAQRTKNTHISLLWAISRNRN